MTVSAPPHPSPIGDAASTGLARRLDDPSSLAWVHDELRTTLASAQKLLRRHLRESESHAGSDVSARELGNLRQARSLIHQGVGATTVIGATAAAQVLAASDAALRWALDRPARLDAKLVEHVEQASFAVIDFLGRQMAGNPVPALWLFPQMRALLETAGAERVHPADLWPRRWEWNVICGVPDTAVRPLDDRSLSALEQLTLANIKTPSPLILARISDLFAGLALAEAALQSERHRTLLQLAAAVFEALAKGLLQADVFSKRLASRLLSLLRGLLRGRQANPDTLQQLAHDLLFFCAQSLPPDSARTAPRLAAVREAYTLDDRHRVDYLNSPLGSFDPAVVVQARKRVVSAKTVWSSIAGGELHHQSSLVEAFSLVADSLRRLFPDGAKLADQLEAIAAQTRNHAEPPAVGLAMEVATALLYVEAALEESEFATPDPVQPITRLAGRIAARGAGGPTQPLEPWIEALYARVADRQTLHTVVQELRASLAAAELQFDRFFRDRTDVAALQPVPAMLQAMRGVLTVLDVQQAAVALQQMRVQTEALLAAGAPEPAPDQLQRLAGNVGALGFLFDMLGVQPVLAKAMFHFDTDRGQLLTTAPAIRDPAPQLAAADAEPTGSDAAAIGAAAGGDEIARTPDEVVSEAAGGDAPAAFADEGRDASSADAGRGVASAAAPVTGSIASAHSSSAEPALRPDVVSSAENDPDPELSAIFNQEAAELLQTARGHLSAWQADGADPVTLTSLRRCFHTLKGSARMVGRFDIGDLAWDAEQRFANRLADELASEVSDALLRDWAGQLVDRLEPMVGWPGSIGASVGTTAPDPFEATAPLFDHEPATVIPTEVDLDITVPGELDFDLSWINPPPLVVGERVADPTFGGSLDEPEAAPLDEPDAEPLDEFDHDAISPSPTDEAPQPLGLPPDLPSAADLDLGFDFASRPGGLGGDDSRLWNASLKPERRFWSEPTRVAAEISVEDIGRSFALPPVPPEEDLSFLSLDLSDPPAQADRSSEERSGSPFDLASTSVSDLAPLTDGEPIGPGAAESVPDLDPVNRPGLLDPFDGFSLPPLPLLDPPPRVPVDRDFVDLALDAPRPADPLSQPTLEPAFEPAPAGLEAQPQAPAMLESGADPQPAGGDDIEWQTGDLARAAVDAMDFQAPSVLEPSTPAAAMTEPDPGLVSSDLDAQPAAAAVDDPWSDATFDSPTLQPTLEGESGWQPVAMPIEDPGAAATLTSTSTVGSQTPDPAFDDEPPAPAVDGGSPMPAEPVVADSAPVPDWLQPAWAVPDGAVPHPHAGFEPQSPQPDGAAWDAAPGSPQPFDLMPDQSWLVQDPTVRSGSAEQPADQDGVSPSPPWIDDVKSIGPLQVAMAQFNAFLNDAEESSRLLCSELAEWAMSGAASVPGSAITRANRLAAGAADVGFAGLSALSRQLEDALLREQSIAWSAPDGATCHPDDARLISDVAEDIRLLLHQFAAGFLKVPAPDLLQRLAAHQQGCEQRTRALDQQRPPAPAAGSPWQHGDTPPDQPSWTPAVPESGAAGGWLSEPVVEEPVWPSAEFVSEPLLDSPSKPPVETPAEPLADPVAEQPMWQAVWPPVEPVPEAPAAQSASVGQLEPSPQPAEPDPAITNGPLSQSIAQQPDPVVTGPAPAERWLADLQVRDQVDPELFAIFQEEAHELLPQLAAALRDWARHPEQPDGADAAMRHLHTFKGGARLAGAMRLGELAHRLESRIEQLTAAAAFPQRDEIDHLLLGSDVMLHTFEMLREAHRPVRSSAGVSVPGHPTSPAPDARVSTERPIDDWPGQPAEEPLRDSAGDSLAGNQARIDWARFQRPAPPAPASARGGAANQQASIRIRASLLERMVNQAGEVNMSRARIEVEMGQVRGAMTELGANVDRLRQQLHDIELQAETQMSSRNESARAIAPAFDPLEIDRFTRLQELARMMSESVNDVAAVHRSLKRNLQRTEDELAAQTRLTRELQSDLLRTRMVEFDTLAERLHRVVRQAANEAGKPVELQIFDGRIELDRSVLDRLTPAFEHLLRNAVIHGIEPARIRQAAGKPATGNLQIRLHQQGNEVSVDVVDDGAGLDLERIRSRAGELGERWVEGQESELIFNPGFSTAERLTESAGRGVGLDVVRNELMAIDGQIEVSSTPGQGCLFSMLLPLTTATTQVLMLRCGELSVAVPATLVERVQRVSEDELAQAQAVGSYSHGGHNLPIFWLGALLLNSAGSAEPFGRTRPLVIVHSGKHRLALHVDEVLGQQEAVVKNLGPQLSRLPGLAGMSMLASGAVALIYNPIALAAEYADVARGLALRAGPALPLQDLQARPPLILVVDDSLTVRRVTQRLLLREGYRVGLAKDGIEAIEQIAQEMPQLVLSDIEMPRMDGYELVEQLRANELTADLPVVMITSRIADKHRVHAESLGVARYLGKPYGEDELLGAVRDCLQRLSVF